MRVGTINSNYTNLKPSNKENFTLTNTSLQPEKLSSLRISSILAKVGVPQSHILIADNYMVIKKVYGPPVVKSRLTSKDKALLGKYDFNQLEYSTIKQINEEIELLKKWSMSLDETLKADSDRILEIRSNELKYLTACRYTLISNEIYRGYLALEKYFEDISKYSL